MGRVSAFGGAATAAFAAILSTGSGARADAKLDEARDVYARGAAEFDRGEFAAAAVDLSRADELVPNMITLETALAAALKSDLATLGMELAERAGRAPMSARLTEAVGAARERFTARTGRVVVRCSSACSPRIDGRPTSAGAPRWVLVGEHAVAIDVGGAEQVRTVVVREAALVQVDAAPPVSAPSVPPPVAPPGPRRAPVASRGLSPIWVAYGAGATALAGGVTIAVGVDTLNRHADFDKSPTVVASNAGKAAELRTNVMIGVTAGCAVATTAIAIFAVRWSSPSGPREASLAAEGPGLRGALRY